MGEAKLPDSDVIIVGGGVSGLATAYFLGQFGIRSVLFEKSNRLGGLIQTESRDGCLLEAGPDSYLSTKPVVTELAGELPALADQIIGSNDASRRIFVVRSGKLTPFPAGMVMMVPTQLGAALHSDLFSARTKLRCLTETLSGPRIRHGDVSVGEFVRDHFGEQLLNTIAEPLLAGVYGGDSASLSARSVLPRFVACEQKYGSLIRGLRHERRTSPQRGSLFLSFRDGMQSLTDALTAAIAHHPKFLGAEITGLERSSARWRVHAAGQWIEARHVVLACPAYVSAALLETAAPKAATELRSIPYSSAILATLVYDRPLVGHSLDGFGFLVPQAERRTIAAATWISTKFPSRVRPGLAAIRAFIVAQKANELRNAPEKYIIDLVRADLAEFMGVNASPRLSMVHAWPDSMPQYIVGHEHRCRNIAAALQDEPGLYLAGNAYGGVGIPDCVRLAKETAKQIFLTEANSGS